MSKRRVSVIAATPIFDDCRVVTTETEGGGKHAACKTPCEECPWRMDRPTGVFPPEVFQHSASTAHDSAFNTFACHMKGVESVSTCAGFLLRHSDNNIGVRLALNRERIDLDRVSDGGLDIYPSYREMAIANGVAPDDPCLAQVRANGEYWDPNERGFRAHRRRSK